MADPIGRKFSQMNLDHEWISPWGPNNIATIVYYAIRNKDLETLEELVKKGHSLNITTNASGNTQFHLAVDSNDERILDYLLSLDTQPINQKNSIDQTPLLQAVSQRKNNLAEKLILAGADVNIPNRSGKTPLHSAVSTPRIAQLLIQYGADIDRRDARDQTALYCAAYEKCLETVSMLLYYNADANVLTTGNYTAFMIAIEIRSEEIQEALFEYVYDYDFRSPGIDLSVLGIALACNSPFAAEMIYRGADVDNVSSPERGPIILALYVPPDKTVVNIENLKLVLKRMNHYESENEFGHTSSFFWQFCAVRNSKLFEDIVDILIESDKFEELTESLNKCDDLIFFTLGCILTNLPFEKYTVIVCLLLSYGYVPNTDDLDLIYTFRGNCELFKMLLCMEIRSSKNPNSILRFENKAAKILHNVKCGRKELFLDLVDYLIKTKIVDEFTDIQHSAIILPLLDYFVHPALNQVYIDKKINNCVTMKINALPKVPSLLELARNETRDHIQKFYAVTTSSRLHTLINNLDIAPAYKEILTYETVIYRPVFTEEEFKKYSESLKMTFANKFLGEDKLASLKYCIIK